MSKNETAAAHLAALLANPIKGYYTTTTLRDNVRSRLKRVPINSFIPFVCERDNIGRLLPPLSERDLGFVRQKNKSVQSSTSSLKVPAFNSTVSKTTSRRFKDIYPSPSIGTYDPKPTYTITNGARPVVLKSATGRLSVDLQRAQTIDFIDYEKVTLMMKKRVSGFSMQHQLARDKEEYDFSREKKELYRAPFVMPDHLKKFKGLFHVCDIKPGEANEMTKNTQDMQNKFAAIKDTITGLKRFGKRITKNMFKSKSDYKCSAG